MLQRISDGLRGQKWLAWIVLGAIALMFVAWGATGIVDFGVGQTTYAAKVNGTKISADEATRAWSERQSEWQQQFQTEIPPAEVATQQDAVLEQLIMRTLVRERVAELGFRVSDAQLKAAIQAEQAFHVDGKFNAQVAKARLDQLGYTEQRYAAEKRDSLQVGQLQNGIRISHFITPVELKRLLELQGQEREVRFAILPADKFAGKAPIEDAALQSYYDKNREQYLTPESATVDYAELRLETIAAQVQPSEEDIRALYEADKARYATNERRRARHILIKIADEKESDAALKTAEQALAEARSGKDFSALAKQYSQDAGSAAQGGDLGWAERGQFVGPFEEALFAMKTDEIRGPIKTQFGYHIIRLDGIEGAKVKSFEEARQELFAKARADRAADLFGERQEQLQQALERPGVPFDELVQQFGLVRGQVAEFVRGGGGEPLGSSKDLQDIVFGDEVLNQGRIGGPQALGEDRLVIVKVVAHRKPEPKPLAAVRDAIVAKLRAERGTAAAMQVAEQAAKQLGASATLESLAAGWGVKPEGPRFVGRGDPSVPAALREAVFAAAKPTAAPVTAAVKLDDGNVAIYQLLQVRAGVSTNPQLDQQLAMFLGQRGAAGDLIAYLDEVRRRAKVEKSMRVFGE